MAFNIQDTGGTLWAVGVDDATGVITATEGPVGVAVPVYLSDLHGATSWQLKMSPLGVLSTTQVPVSIAYPTFLQLSALYNLQVSNLGILQAVPVSAPAFAPLPATAVPANPPGQLIPLTPSPTQSFSVDLTVDGAPLTLNITIRWNSMAGYWVLTIEDSAGNLLLDSIPVLTGWFPSANLLEQYIYLAIGSAFIINNGTTDSDYPGQPDLGSGFSLIWDNTPTEPANPNAIS